MEEMWTRISEFAGTPLAILIGPILGLLGITLAIIFYLKSKRYKELKFFVTSRTLFNEPEKKLKGLQITYNTVPQKCITIARVTIWNSGTETVVSDDIPTKYPLFIHLGKECEVLECTVVRITEDATSFQIGNPENYEEGTKIPLSFEYLDKEHGATIQVVHNGQENIPLKVKGKIKGGYGPNEIDTIFTTIFTRLGNPKFGVFFYSAVGVALITARFVTGSGWGYIAGGLFCFFAAFVMYIGYAKGQVPMKYLRDL